MRITRLQDFIVRLIGSRIDEAQSASIAAATTTDLNNATGNQVPISGTAVNIKGFGTMQAGARFVLSFTGACVLISVDVDATSKITVPGQQSLTTASGDLITVRSEGSGYWIVEAIQPANTRIGITRYSSSVAGQSDSLTGDTDANVLAVGLSLDPQIYAYTAQVTITGALSVDSTGVNLVIIGATQDVTAAPAPGDTPSGNVIASNISIGSALSAQLIPFSLVGFIEVAANDTPWVYMNAQLSSGTDTVALQDVTITVAQVSP